MKSIISIYKKSVYEIGLKKEIEALLWDFYVTRSFASSASQKRAVSDYGLKQIPLKEMLVAAGIENEKSRIITCTTLKNTLEELDFETEIKDRSGKKTEKEIDIETPRLCCIQGFTVNEDLKIIPSGSQADVLFSHIRNAFAHGNTYFFDNRMVLLEDKDRAKITARIFLKTEILVKWIQMVDKNGIVYPSIFGVDDLTQTIWESDGN